MINYRRKRRRERGTRKEMIKDKNAKKIILFASENDAEDNNSPLLNALIEYEIPYAADLDIVGDGAFLTAARWQRYTEIRQVATQVLWECNDRYAGCPSIYTKTQC